MYYIHTHAHTHTHTYALYTSTLYGTLNKVSHTNYLCVCKIFTSLHVASSIVTHSKLHTCKHANLHIAS